MSSLQSLEFYTWDFYLDYTSILHILQSLETSICDFYIGNWCPSNELSYNTCFLPGMQPFRCPSYYRPYTRIPSIGETLVHEDKRQLFRLASSSKETLRTLQFPISIFMFKWQECSWGPEYSDLLWNTSFPLLINLEVTDWDLWPDEADTYRKPLREFLIAHPDFNIGLEE